MDDEEGSDGWFLKCSPVVPVLFLELACTRRLLAMNLLNALCGCSCDVGIGKSRRGFLREPPGVEFEETKRTSSSGDANRLSRKPGVFPGGTNSLGLGMVDNLGRSLCGRVLLDRNTISGLDGGGRWAKSGDGAGSSRSIISGP
jgi:hypothetical protein